jgi:hypothetical protein
MIQSATPYVIYIYIYIYIYITTNVTDIREFDRSWKEAVVSYHRHCPEICLEDVSQDAWQRFEVGSSLTDVRSVTA